MGEYPVNQAAIKMLNKLVEAHPPPVVASALSDVMPGLIMVRIFCSFVVCIIFNI